MYATHSRGLNDILKFSDNNVPVFSRSTRLFWLKLYLLSEQLLVKIIYIMLKIFILTANGFLSGGSGSTIRHNTQITYHIK
jgi:hypothetical protein